MVMADPNVIAILQNLGANIIWAIGESGIRGIKEKVVSKPNRFRWFHRDVDPVEIGPNLREVLVVIAHNNQGKSARVKFKTSLLNGEKSGPERDIVILNSASSMIVSGMANNWNDAIKLASDSIDSGKAMEKLNRLIVFTQAL